MWRIGMSAFTKIVIKIYNKVSNNTISEYGDALHTQTIALSVIWGAMMYSLIKKLAQIQFHQKKQSSQEVLCLLQLHYYRLCIEKRLKQCRMETSRSYY